MKCIVSFRRIWFSFGVAYLFLAVGPAYAGAYKYRYPSAEVESAASKTVVGYVQIHTVNDGDTLLDIARNYGLGFNEIQLLYPHLDPWIPESGLRLFIPTLWVLPPTQHHGVVINLPEMRLYRFFPRIEMVKTYPVGIGDLGWETPEGVYRVVEHEVNPTWVIPPSLRKEYGVSRIPPGPDNPLGNYWMGLSAKRYGIHGTNFPWGVGRLVSHGCIRLYPEHIAELFKETPVGTPVEIIYEPVKIGFRNGEIFVEVHPDPYGKMGDMELAIQGRLKALDLWDNVLKEDLKMALLECSGVPVRIGREKKGGDKFSALESMDVHSPKNSTIQMGKEVTQ